MGAYKKGRQLRLPGEIDLRELECKGTGCCTLTYIDDSFLEKLNALSGFLGEVSVLKGYECEKKAERKDSMHCLGKAADITVTNRGRPVKSEDICRAAEKIGFSGIIRKDEYTVHLDTRLTTCFYFDKPLNMFTRGWT